MRQKSIFLILFFAGSALLATACGSSQAAEAQAQATAVGEVEIGTPVEVADVATGDIALVYAYNGNLKSKDEVDVTPSISGKIEAVLVDVGDEVKAGDIIATIEQNVYLAQLKQAQAGLTRAELELQKMKIGTRPEEIAVAQAAVEVARAALDDVATIDDDERTSAAANLARTQAALRAAQAEYDKIAWAGDVGNKPEAVALEQATIAYENALADYNLRTNPSDSQLAPLIVQLAQAELNLVLKQQPFREVDFAIAESGTEQAKAAVELAEIQLDNTTIEAPFDGVIAELYVTTGSSVSPQSPVTRFVSSQVDVAVEIEESRIGQIFEGQNVSLQLGAYPGQVFPALVTSIAPTADDRTHTFTIEVTPVDSDGLLRSGMFANASILVAEKQDTVIVPRDAVTQVGNQSSVYVVELGSVKQQTVVTGLSDGNRIEILSGLEPGETIVTAGQPNLTDGAKVEVVNRL